jgi:hypothetical protein
MLDGLDLSAFGASEIELRPKRKSGYYRGGTEFAEIGNYIKNSLLRVLRLCGESSEDLLLQDYHHAIVQENCPPRRLGTLPGK